jgi:aerobic C4-dicarboxylate transport protein
MRPAAEDRVSSPLVSRRILRSLYFQVLVGVALGVLLGCLRPAWAQEMKPLGDGFIKLVKMLIAPIVFATVVTGIARIGDLRKVGRVGWKSLIYFEALTTLALLIGLVVAKTVAPGAGINADPASIDTHALKEYQSQGQHLGVVEFLLGMIPDTVVGAFARGEILPVLVVSLLFGAALAGLGTKAGTLVDLVDQIGHAFFAVVGMIMRLAPLGAFGAMAFTVGKYGLASLAGLGKLMLTFYTTSLLFVCVVLALVAWRTGFSLFRFLRYIREEIVLVLGTSSSESALPRLMAKLEALGCGKSVVGLVVPMGYSFNLDGTSIYLTMATVFMAQAMNIELPLGEELSLLGVLLLTSKGAAAVTGGGFITLAATLSATGRIPVAGLALLLGVDRFMSEARAITNLIGNGVATMVVAKWEGELDMERVNRVLHLRHTDHTNNFS